MQLPFSICWAWQLHLVWFAWFQFYEVWSDCSVLASSVWSFLSVLVWRVSYSPDLVALVHLLRPDRVCSVLLCSFSLHWFGRGCSVTGRCVVVELSPVLFALVLSVVLYSRLVCSRLFGWFTLLQLGLV